MSVHETYYLQPTTQIESTLVENNKSIQFTVVDFPGNINLAQMQDSAIA